MPHKASKPLKRIEWCRVGKQTIKGLIPFALMGFLYAFKGEKIIYLHVIVISCHLGVTSEEWRLWKLILILI